MNPFASHQGVIVTDGDERSALAITRSLGRRGIAVYVGAERAASLAGSSKYCKQSFAYPSPWNHPAEYKATLLAAMQRWEATVLFPVTDIAVELMGEHKERSEQEFVMPIPSLAQYRKLSDKYHLAMWAEQQGIPIPGSIFVPDGDVTTVSDRITRWPVVVKPGRSLLQVDGQWKKTSVCYARDLHELRRLYSDIWYLRWPSLIQERIAGEGQGVFGLFRGGEPLALFAHRRLREKPPSGGVSVLRESIALPKQMTDYAVRVARSVEWDGVVMVEFKVDLRSHIPYLMEVNGRFWGSLQLAVDAGIDFPWLLYQLATTGKASPESPPYKVAVRSRWWLGDLDHMFIRLRTPEHELNLAPGSPSRWATAWEFFRPTNRRTQSEVLRLSDPRPGMRELADYSRPVLNAVRMRANAAMHNLPLATARVLWRFGLLLGVHRIMLAIRFPTRPKRVLVLCTGNICRSPFVDQWLRVKIGGENLPIEVASAGLDTTAGKEAYHLAQSTAREFGIDLKRHRTVCVTSELVEKADVILVMELAHVRQLLKTFPHAKRKTFLLGHFLPQQPVTEIQDPFGCARERFISCYALLHAACEGFLTRLRDAGHIRERLAEPYRDVSSRRIS